MTASKSRLLHSIETSHRATGMIKLYNVVHRVHRPTNGLYFCKDGDEGLSMYSSMYVLQTLCRGQNNLTGWGKHQCTESNCPPSALREALMLISPHRSDATQKNATQCDLNKTGCPVCLYTQYVCMCKKRRLSFRLILMWSHDYHLFDIWWHWSVG